jgi:hypothetical protein
MNKEHIIRAKFNKIVERQSEIMDLIKDIERDLNARIEYAPVFPSQDTKYKSYSYDNSMYSGSSSVYDDSDNESYGNEYDIGFNIDEKDMTDSLLNISPNLLNDLGMQNSETKESMDNHLQQDEWFPPKRPGLDNSRPLI